MLLTLQHYLLKGDYFIFFLESIQSNYPDLAAYLFSEENFRLSYLMYWALGQTLLYVVIPVIQILFFFRQPLSDYGLKIGGFASLWWLYLAMLSVMVPIVLMVSQTESFQSTYPFYRGALNESMWPRFWSWESAYFLQFIGLEFFFRGYLLHGVKRRFGAYAIFVMMVPYCMIHFGKPMPETLGAIVAGLALGYLALKSKSWVHGALLHWSIGITMDLLAIFHKGGFK